VTYADLWADTIDETYFDGYADAIVYAFLGAWRSRAARQ
jgi:hypothetical protein